VDWHRKGSKAGFMNPPYGRAINLIKLHHDFPELYETFYRYDKKKKVERFFAKEFRELHPDLAKQYTHSMEEWIHKAYRTANRMTMVCLLPARTDTRWYHTFVDHTCADEECQQGSVGAGEVRFIPGRLTFEGQATNDPAPFPSLLLIFRKAK